MHFLGRCFTRCFLTSSSPLRYKISIQQGFDIVSHNPGCIDCPECIDRIDWIKCICWKSKPHEYINIDIKVPSLRNIILISDVSKPGTIRFSHFALNIRKQLSFEGCANGNSLGSRTWWPVEDLERPRRWLSWPTRSGWTMPATSRFGNVLGVILACLQFTSGTTGNPKGVTLSHHNLVNNAFNIGHRVGYDAEVASKSKMILDFNHHKQVHRICCSVPFYHCFGNVAGTLASLLHGASLVVPCPRWSILDHISYSWGF